MKKSKREFETKYMEELGFTKSEYDGKFVTLSCNCGVTHCSGWASIDNNEKSINTHISRFGEHNGS